jgi:hypothetical protein
MGGTISNMEIVKPGTYYRIESNVCCVDGKHTDCVSIITPKINITNVGADGEILDFSIESGGMKFKVGDYVIVKGGVEDGLLKITEVSD